MCRTIISGSTESCSFCRLCRVVNEMGDKTAIIFVNKKKTADTLSRQLDKNGYRVTTLHGGKTQEQREVRLNLVHEITSYQLN